MASKTQENGSLG